MVCWLGAEGFCPWYAGLVLRVSVLGMLAWCRGCLSLVCWLGAEGWYVGLVLRVSVLGMLAGAENVCPWYVGLVQRMSGANLRGCLSLLAWC